MTLSILACGFVLGTKNNICTAVYNSTKYLLQRNVIKFVTLPPSEEMQFL